MLTIATAITNRSISAKNISWNFIEPFDFTEEILARPARFRGEQGNKIPAEISLNPVQWALIENARTVFQKNK